MRRIVDDLSDIVGLVLALLIGATVLGFSTKSLYDVVIAYNQEDKIEVSYETTANPYELTAYQAYMLGYVMDVYAPDKYSQVLYNGTKYAVLSKSYFGGNYTERNRTIREQVGAMLLSGIQDNAKVNHYRGLDGRRYQLQFIKNPNKNAPKISDNVYSGYIWTVQRE